VFNSTAIIFRGNYIIKFLKKVSILKTSFSKFSISFLLIIFLYGNIIYAQETSFDSDHMFSVTQGLQSPVRIAIDKQDIIYVTDAFQKCIVRYDTTGNFLGTINPGGIPISIAINDENQIFIGDGETGTILKLDETGIATEFYTETVFPSSMVFSPDNLLYVVDSKLKQVIVLDLFGNVVRTIGDGTLILPTGIAYDHRNNQVCVSEHGGIGTGFKPLVKIWIFDLQGNLIRSLGSHGNGDGQFYRIQGLAVGRCGKIYATDPFQATVSVFDEAGFVAKFGEYGKELGQLNAPVDIVVDSRGHIWITSMNNGSLEVYNINEIGPSSNITSANTSICQGESTNIIIDFTGTAPWTFTYTIDGLNPTTISNTTDNPYILTVSEAGIYEITALSDANYVATCFTGSVDIGVNPLPTVSLGEDIDICEGEIYTLDAGASFISYLWNDGSTNQTLDVSTSGNYRVIVSDGKGCENSDEISVLVNLLPVAEFTYTENSLEISFLNNSTNADSYFWDFDDNETSQEMNPVHVYKTSGEYKVVLTASNEKCGDKSFSKTINILGTLAESIKLKNFAKIYPNPSNGIITIEINNPVQSDIRVEITNISGQKVYSKVFKIQKVIDQINLSSFPKGIYTIEFISKDMVKTDKIIIK